MNELKIVPISPRIKLKYVTLDGRLREVIDTTIKDNPDITLGDIIMTLECLKMEYYLNSREEME